MDLCRDPKTMEPEDETGEEFVDWAERHEELEDLADEIVEQLEALGERVD